MLIQLLPQLILFLLLCFLLFYSTGFLILCFLKEDLKNYEIISLSFSLGLVLFVLVVAFFGLIHLRFLALPLLAILSGLSILKNKTRLLTPWLVFKKNKFLSILIFLGILVQGFINFPSGFLYENGLLFWSSQGHDGLWHVTLMEEISRSFPPQNPIFAGERLYNYHFLIDLVMGEFYRIFSFYSPLDLYFRFFPVLLSFMIGMAVFSFVSHWRKNEKIGYLGLFFTYFTGSFGFIANYIKGGSILGGETLFWAAQGNTILGNPPHAASYALLPAFFLSFAYLLERRTKRWFAIAFFLGAVLAGFKVSGGFVMLAGVGAAALLELIFYKKFLLTFLAGALGISNFLTFKSMTTPDASSLLMFLPWWFVRTTIVDRLGWIDLENRRQFYVSKGTWHAWLRVVELETFAFLLFLVGNTGMRILGFIEIGREFLRKTPVFKRPLEAALLVTMFTGLIVPIFFVQRGIIYNNIQFMQYYLLIGGFYAAVFVYKIFKYIKSIPLKVIIFLLILSLALPTVIGNLTELYAYGGHPLAVISNPQIKALDFLKEHSLEDDVILTVPFNKYLHNKYKTQPWPIYAWYSTGYVTALSQRRTFLSTEEQALIQEYPVEERRKQVEKFFSQQDFSWNKKFLHDNNIRFIYISKDEIEKLLDVIKNNLTKIFENSEVIIYRVNN